MKNITIQEEDPKYIFTPRITYELKKRGFTQNELSHHQYCNKKEEINLYAEKEGYDVQIVVHGANIDETINKLEKVIKKLNELKSVFDE